MARVLIADDSAHLRLLVRHTLDLDGHEVLEAGDVCRAAREDAALKSIGIVILSANATTRRATEAGADR